MTPATGATDQGAVNRDAAVFDVDAVRRDFPILTGIDPTRPLAYLDNAATSQKPAAVIDAETRFYREYNANIHRGVHRLSVVATEAYENARTRIQRFLNANDRSEIVFVRGATEGINLVAQSFARPRLNPGDEILLSTMEHHSNIVPWQIVAEQTGAVVRVAPIDDRGCLVLEEFKRLLTDRTRIVALTHVSNTLGTINPATMIRELAHQCGATVLFDGAQAVPHMPVDVQSIGCDFYVFSGHKAFGPTGIGALYGKKDLLEQMQPYQAGGEMIKSVTFEKTVYNDVPFKFEAGTPNIAGSIGLGAAIEYLESIGPARIAEYEKTLLEYGNKRLQAIPGLRLFGTADEKAAVFSFTIDGVHAHDVGTILDGFNVAVRTGHHCTQPIMDHFGIPATSRASLAFYNTTDEIDRLADGLEKVVEVFAT